jgi:hypothetical protein
MSNFRLLLLIAGMITYLILCHFLGSSTPPHPAAIPAKPSNSATDGDKLDLIREPDQVVTVHSSAGPG